MLLCPEASELVGIGPGWVGQLVKALSQYTKVVGSIPSLGIYRNQPISAQVEQQIDVSLSLTLPLPSSVSKINQSIRYLINKLVDIIEKCSPLGETQSTS